MGNSRTLDTAQVKIIDFNHSRMFEPPEDNRSQQIDPSPPGNGKDLSAAREYNCLNIYGSPNKIQHQSKLISNQ